MYRLIVVLSLFMAACGGDGDSGGVCGSENDLVPSIIDDADLATFKIGKIGIEERQILSGNDVGHTTLVQAHFSDFYNFRVMLADRKVFSEACFVYVSLEVVDEFCRPSAVCGSDQDCPAGSWCHLEKCIPIQKNCSESSECDGLLTCQQGLCMWPPCDGGCEEGYSCLSGQPAEMLVAGVSLDGLAAGSLELTTQSDGRIAPQILDGRAFLAETIGIDVAESADQNGMNFFSFSEEISAPEFPELLSIGEHQNPDLVQGVSLGMVQRSTPLRVEWTAGEGDFVEIKIIPGDDSDTRYQKLRCITYDDGCFEIPASALGHLAQDSAANFQFMFERHHSVVHPIKEGDQVKAAAIIETSSIIEGTVGR
jgi:hypothetical protein